MRDVSERAKPVLWHIPISHYSEKARWALDHKDVEHERRAPPPGLHMGVALWLTRGAHKTFPILELGGRCIGDSTAIIAALEEAFPDTPLYPQDPGERERALELEDWFDEELGPPVRLLGWHEVLRARMQGELAEPYLPRALRGRAAARRAVAGYTSVFAGLRYGVKSEQAAAAARDKIVAALDRLEAELDGRDHLAGDSFTVADLTAAALFYPLVLPAEGPSLPVPSGEYERFQDSLAERPGFQWVAEMFRRHRKARATASAAAS